ncbi:hypothetical protein [Janthinobacterium fluminis]|uniref:Uncharacterized protein n=1 Tax=Janthinobacterium fluminis TaxID=2987524 RepID=A0ABT5K3V6_9BURK|nr:hypothetical protein [Janthinobacterium fluminis]MDC8758412.1 hypothetical protein [Janthinobacterium fluminis]
MRAIILGDSNDLPDEEGRPVGEVRASEPVRKARPTLYAICPYRGSRQRSVRMMNVSALRQLTSVWPQPLAILSQVRRMHGIQPGAPPPLLTLCRIGFTALCLPAYLAYRSAPCAIPVSIAATHKMCQGLFGLCKNLLIDRVSRGENFRETVANVGDLYRFAEHSGILLSRTGIEACAAPPAMISEALRLLVLGTLHDEEEHASAGAWHGDGEPLLAYSAAVADMTIWTTVSAIALRSAMERVIAARAELAGHTGVACEDAPAPAGYLLSGLNDAVIGPVLAMPDDIRHHYALGAIALCSTHAAGAGLRALLDRCGPADLTLPPAAQDRAACLMDTALGIENDALRVFDYLQQRVMAALGRPALPFSSLATTVSETFGHLPSHYT